MMRPPAAGSCQVFGNRGLVYELTLERRLAVFHVVGGVFTDMTFSKLEPGEKMLRLGPFETYEEARVAWRDIASRTLDICTAKYWIEGEPERKN
jgi:hypothetical protein